MQRMDGRQVVDEQKKNTSTRQWWLLFEVPFSMVFPNTPHAYDWSGARPQQIAQPSGHPNPPAAYSTQADATPTQLSYDSYSDTERTRQFFPVHPGIYSPQTIDPSTPSASAEIPEASADWYSDQTRPFFQFHRTPYTPPSIEPERASSSTAVPEHSLDLSLSSLIPGSYPSAEHCGYLASYNTAASIAPTHLAPSASTEVSRRQDMLSTLSSLLHQHGAITLSHLDLLERLNRLLKK